MFTKMADGDGLESKLSNPTAPVPAELEATGLSRAMECMVKGSTSTGHSRNRILSQHEHIESMPLEYQTEQSSRQEDGPS
jgi:hypothetical protein